MVDRVALLDYLEELLHPEQFQDYCPNGLQVAGSESIGHIVSGVTASQALIDKAIELKADTLLVHHGYFWRGEDPRLIGMKRQRLAKLLQHNINLIAYHLPLDGHASLGNNVQLAKRLDLHIEGTIAQTGRPALALMGSLKQPKTIETFTQDIITALDYQPVVISGHDRMINTIGWCTGAAQGYIEQAAAQGLDAFLSGEISEQTAHQARELGIHYFAAGHHATERYGVQALGEALAGQFSIRHQFIDIDNPA